jgi:hypothetical protein
MKTKHTEVPWHVNAIDSKRGRIVGDETAPPDTWDKLQINGGNCTIATVYRPKDARMICTAVNCHQELLESCKKALAVLANGEHASGLALWEVREKLIGAIAKATGE